MCENYITGIYKHKIMQVDYFKGGQFYRRVEAFVSSIESLHHINVTRYKKFGFKF